MVNKYARVYKAENNNFFIQIVGTFGCLVLSTTGFAASSFDLNQDWTLETNTSLSFGASWSMQDPAESLLFKPDAAAIGKVGSSLDVNGDDGRMNFSKHDNISQIVKGLTEFKLNGKKQGAVLSTKYWYDHAYETGNGEFKTFDDSDWPRLAKFKGIDLWDAYIWKNFDLPNGQSFNAKLGKHSLNWGKSQFMQNGLNAVSAFDLAAMNRPGGEAKERIIPVEMFSFNAGINENLSIEGFYQFKFRPSVVDGCGTFFAITDLVPEGCGPMVQAGVGDKTSDSAMKAHSYIPRVDTRLAKDSGQYGLALKQILPSLNNAELGIYYANYHNRYANFDATTVTALGPANYNTGNYYAVYVENIKMYGLSLSVKKGSTTFFSELTHKPNQPMQVNGSDIVFYQVLFPDTPFAPPGETLGFGELATGYKRLPFTQFSIGASDSISNILGATSLLWSGEFAVNHIANIGDQRYGRSSAFGRSELTTGAYNPETGAFKCTAYGAGNLTNEQVDRMNEKYCNSKDGFFSAWSFGYRLRGALSYDDVFAGTVITPSLTFRHDIHGYGPNFQQGQMALGAALSATYNKKYTTEFTYYNYFGSNEFSVIDDRDFASLAFKVNF